MSSGPAKRPLDPRVRGSSPANKRSRPLQTKNAAALSPKIQSPPPSRKSSGARLSIVVPDDTKVAPACNRPVDSAHGKDRPQEKPGRSDQTSTRVASVTSHRPGSTASTSIQHSAPSAPSMLPTDSRQYANAAQSQDKTANDKPPLGMPSLRKLQDRRRAIATQLSSTNGPASATTQLEAKITAQQLEIAQLRRERDELERRLTKMENSLDSLSRSANGQQHQQRPDSSKDLQPVLNRLTALENSSLILELQKTASGAVAKTLALEKEMIMLKRSQESQKNEIATLNTWKPSQPKTMADNLVKLATDKIAEKKDETKALMRKEIIEVEGRPAQRSSSGKQPLQDVSSKAKDVESLTATIQEFTQRLTDIELDMDRTNSKVEKIEDDLLDSSQHARRIGELEENMDRCLDFRQKLREAELPSLQLANEDIDRRLSKLEQSMRDQNRSTEKAYGEAERTAFPRSVKGQSTVESVDLGNLALRVDELERAEQSSESNRPSTSTISSASVNTLARNVEQLAKDFKSFQHTQKESRDSQSKLLDVVKRLDTIEQNLKGLEELKDHVVLDKALEASHTELHRRVLSEIHALQTDLDSKITNIQTHQSNVPSEDAPAERETNDSGLETTTTALLSRINDMQLDLDSLFDGFNEAGQKIYEHSATIAVIKDQVPEIFRLQFDPFKHTVEEQFSTINGKLDAHVATLAELQREFAEAHASTAQALTTKADTQAVGKQVDSITFALKDLEHRYQNITTEEMHQKMVHWFVQMYPSSAALIRDTVQIQQDIIQLKNYCNEIAWVRSRSGVLNDLCRHGAQLQAIAQQYSPQNQGKIEQALSDAQVGLLQAQQAERETQERVSQITAQVAEMQAAAHEHRRDFDTIKDTLIEPNRDFFGLFGTVLSVLAQLQQVAESLNQNLPGTPLKLDWESYLPSLVERPKTGTEEKMGRNKQ